MSRKRKILWGAALTLVLYVGSYALMSVGGYFKPTVFGLVSDSNGDAILAPKASHDPYYWHPFEVFKEDGGPTTLAIFYYPLLMIDTKVIHHSSLADSGLYRVKDYFDRELMSYRDVEPN